MTKSAGIYELIEARAEKRRNMTPLERYRRSLRQVVGTALLVGYSVGWRWRGQVERAANWRASSRKSGA